MKQNRFSKAIITLLAVFLLIGAMCTYAYAEEAVEQKPLGNAYGEIIPTDSKLSAQKTSYTFYGDSGNLYFMRISKGKDNAWFAVEIFSDSQYKNQIRSFKDQFSTTPGNKPLSVTWNFKTLESGTYYGRCYTYNMDGETKVIDTNSYETFTIEINRVGNREVTLKSIVNTANGPQVTWNQVPTAKKYNVYRRAAGEKSWTYLKTLGENDTTYTDSTAKSGKYYAYTVKCSDGKNVSLYNKKGLLTYYLAQPQIKSMAGVYSTGAANIKWSAVDGAQGYYIYRKGGTLSDYDWVCIATIKNGKTTSYIDSKARSADWSYSYTVKAYYGKYLSAHNATGIEFNFVDAPKITKVGVHQDGMEITWTANDPDITTFYVYRKNGSSWKLVGTTKDKAFVDKTVVTGNFYTYTVKAACKTNAGAFNQKGITAKYVATPKLQPLTFDYNYKAQVKWSAVDGAAGYKIYRKVNNSKSWYLLATIKSGKTTSYIDSSKKYSGAEYSYTVRAYDAKGYHSWFVPTGTTSVCLAKPLFTVAQKDTTDKSTAIEITWPKVNGATNYNVYRKAPGGSWEALVRATKELSFVDKTVASGVAYQYAVRSLDDKGSISSYYTKTATAVSAPVISSVLVEDAGVKITWSAVKDASYTVYRAKAGTTAWENIGTATATSYTDTATEAKAAGYVYCVSATVNKLESIKSNAVSNITEITAKAEFDKATGSIKLSWDSPLAHTIIISKATGSDEAVELGVYSTSLYKAYEDVAVEEGKSYTYTLVAQGSNKVDGTITVTATYPLPPLKPSKITGTSTDYNNGDAVCNLSWSAVEFASEYTVLRSTNSKDYEPVGTVKATEAKDGILSYTDHISAEIEYTYKIKAVSSEKRDPSYTDATAKLIAYTPLTAVSDLKASGKYNHETEKVEISLSWSKTEKAECYIISRKTGDSEYAPVTSLAVDDNGVHPLSYIDTTAQVDVEYTYKIEAYSSKHGRANNTVSYIYKTAE